MVVAVDERAPSLPAERGRAEHHEPFAHELVRPLRVPEDIEGLRGVSAPIPSKVFLAPGMRIDKGRDVEAASVEADYAAILHAVLDAVSSARRAQQVVVTGPEIGVGSRRE